MAKRQSEEARLIKYVETAPLPSAEIVMGIANAKLKERQKAEGSGRSTTRTSKAPKTDKNSSGSGTKETPGEPSGT